MASDIGSWGYWRWLDGAAGAIAGGCDGLTDAILLVAEIAATRRLDRLLKSLFRRLCNQLRLMQVWKRGDGDGVEDGELCCEEESPAVREESADLGVYH